MNTSPGSRTVREFPEAHAHAPVRRDMATIGRRVGVPETRCHGGPAESAERHIHQLINSDGRWRIAVPTLLSAPSPPGAESGN